MAYKAYYHNPRDVRQPDGTTKVMYYYRIVGMTPEDKALYKADKGIYYVEDEAGTPMFSLTNTIRGLILEIVRASKPNPKTGTYSWYAKRSFVEHYEALAKEFPALAQFDKEELKSMARQMYTSEVIEFADAPKDSSELGTF
jgi:hypothetical protein